VEEQTPPPAQQSNTDKSPAYQFVYNKILEALTPTDFIGIESLMSEHSIKMNQGEVEQLDAQILGRKEHLKNTPAS